MKQTKTEKALVTVESMDLQTACARYLEHLKALGQRPSTIRTARRTLDLLIGEMGEEKDISHVQEMACGRQL